MTDVTNLEILKDISELEEPVVLFQKDDIPNYFAVRKGLKRMRADLDKAEALRKSIGWD